MNNFWAFPPDYSQNIIISNPDYVWRKEPHFELPRPEVLPFLATEPLQRVPLLYPITAYLSL